MWEIRARSWPMPAAARVGELAPSAATRRRALRDAARPSRFTVTATKSG